MYFQVANLELGLSIHLQPNTPLQNSILCSNKIRMKAVMIWPNMSQLLNSSLYFQHEHAQTAALPLESRTATQSCHKA